jgi:hypothetical protein
VVWLAEQAIYKGKASAIPALRRSKKRLGLSVARHIMYYYHAIYNKDPDRDRLGTAHPQLSVTSSLRFEKSDRQLLFRGKEKVYLNAQIGLSRP